MRINFKKYSTLLFRLALGGIFIYFGYLAVSDPETTAFRFASPQILSLATTFVSLQTFMIGFGILQIVIGLAIIVDKYLKVALTVAAFMLVGIIASLGIYTLEGGINELALRDFVILTSVIYLYFSIGKHY